MGANASGWLLAFALALSGLVHLLPVSGAISARRLHALYGMDGTDPVTLLLLRHRALLFGLLGVFLLLAAFTPAWRIGASVVALFSMLSFVALAAGQQLGRAVRRIARIDLVLSTLLVLALALWSIAG